MKSTEKYVEIMEKLTGIELGATVTFKENKYEVSDINTDDLEAMVSLTAEGQEPITIGLKELVESEEHVIEAKKNEEMDDEEDDEKDDKKGEDDKEMDDKDDKEMDDEKDVKEVACKKK